MFLDSGLSLAKVRYLKTLHDAKDKIPSREIVYEEAATYSCIALLELEHPHSLPFPSKDSRDDRTVASVTSSDSYRVLV